MNVENHVIKNYRNIGHMELEPVNGINVIFGENGHGKTNIIESIWLFTGCNSFRTRKNAELVKNGSNSAELCMDFNAYSRRQNSELIIDEKKDAYINGIKQISPRKFLGEFHAVVFSPSMLSVIEGGPSEKRKFIDIAISLIKPNYAALLSKYNKAVSQRNALLKDISSGKGDENLLYVFDGEIARYGGRIIDYRVKYIENLKKTSSEIYSGISNEREEMTLSYINSVKGEASTPEEWFQLLYDESVKNHKRDVMRLATSVGPHKDDIDIFLDGLNVRAYGSRGQQRTCALAMKLSEASIIKEISGEQPVALLDDVMSELDDARQKYLIKYFDGWQVFVTCCDKSHLDKINYERAFEICDGRIKL